MPQSEQHEMGGLILPLGAALPGQTPVTSQHDPETRPVRCDSPGTSPTASDGSSVTTAGSTLPKPIHSASHKLEDLVHTT